jgi:ribosomal protein S18 acetylase RimI-like enzyme
MTVSLRPMTSEEFVAYEDSDAHRYAETMVRAGYWSAEGALARAQEAPPQLLPDGVSTVDHVILVVEAPEQPAPIGVVWLSIQRETIPPTGFLYDLLIHEPHRGRGYGRQAMLALEAKARELGLAALSLHVFEDNAPARSLYASLGYQVRSMNMAKRLTITRDRGA